MRDNADNVVPGTQAEGHLLVEAGVVNCERRAAAQLSGENQFVWIERSLERIQLHYSKELPSGDERKNERG